MVTLRSGAGASVGVNVAATMSKVTSAVAVSGVAAESLAVTTITTEPIEVGFPLNWPVASRNDMPEGKSERSMEKLTGAVMFATAKLAEGDVVIAVPTTPEIVRLSGVR